MEIDIDSYEHFSFDLWLTMIKSNPDFKAKRDTLFRDFFSIDKDIDEVRKVIRKYDVLFNRISEKTGNHIEREEVFLLMLDALGKDIETVDDNQLKQFFQQVDELFLNNKPVLLWESIEEILIKIKEKNKTASILSNTAFIHGDSLRKVLEHLGLADYFSFMIFSDEVKASKPNLRVFEIMFDEINTFRTLEKKEILHIGDNKTADYEGAKTFGVNSKLVKF
ncbi:HAD family hydrolase [Epilithonimonas zeae]|uniref:Putative hydrolase of the HAD superfamily n=1 Tax=Epilithonimonas zeae TaxID=1416779 RepID=A0A1N6IND3_9FLAO|nr:HAD family hydrolase [Epilithonimonas zeae]SIO33445.1 putative hydrolase of the HAD superfamily [Epilithonimonas zeae]